MDEIDINAKFAALCSQRNDAANSGIILSGALAVAQNRVKRLEAELAEQADQHDAEFGRLHERIAALEAQLAETVATEDAQTTIEGVGNV